MTLLELLKEFAKKALSFIDYFCWLLFSPFKFTRMLQGKDNPVLIVNLGFIGDLLATTPLIHELAKTRKVDIAILPSMQELFVHNHSVREIILFSDAATFLARIKDKYDTAMVICPSSLQMVLLLRKARVRYLLGFPSYHAPGLHGSFFTRLHFPSWRKRHKVIENASFLKFIGHLPPLNPEIHPMRLLVSSQELASVRKTFSIPHHFVILSPSSRSQRNMGVPLPGPVQFAALGDYLIEKHRKNIVLVGSRDEAGLCKEIQKSSRNPKKMLDLSGKTSIRHLAALLKLAELVVAVDSGTVHLATTQKKKIVDLMRANQVDIWRPWMEQRLYRLIISQNNELDELSLQEIQTAIDDLLSS